MYKVLIAGAAVLFSGFAHGATPNQVAYGAVSEHAGCAAIQAEARAVQQHVIALDAALSKEADPATTSYVDDAGSMALPQLELELARARLSWLRQIAGKGNCSGMPAWHELERTTPWQNPLA